MSIRTLPDGYPNESNFTQYGRLCIFEPFNWRIKGNILHCWMATSHWSECDVSLFCWETLGVRLLMLMKISHMLPWRPSTSFHDRGIAYCVASSSGLSILSHWTYSLGISWRTRWRVQGVTLDFQIPQTSMKLNICGMYWTSSISQPTGPLAYLCAFCWINSFKWWWEIAEIRKKTYMKQEANG